jgi:glycine betaine/proline transport system substrate-binding protein
MAYDCGKPFGWIKKVGWKEGESKWPGAYSAVQNFKIDNAQMSAMIVEVDLNGRSVDEVVAEWMSNNETVWQGWIQ